MKKIIILVVSLFCGITLFSQTPVLFPDGKLLGNSYRPRIGISPGGEVFSGGLVMLMFIDRDDYAEFDENSRIVFKLEDDSRISCPYFSPAGVNKDYRTEWNDTFHRFADYYTTITGYESSGELVDAVIKNGKKIVKIRVVFANNEIQDYDIKKSYQSKFVSNLQKYYYSELEKEEKEKNIPSDDEF